MLGAWPYLLGTILLLLFIMIAVSVAVGAFKMLAGGRVRSFEEFDAEWVLNGSRIDGKNTTMTFDEFEADWKRRGSPIS